MYEYSLCVLKVNEKVSLGEENPS